MPQTTRILTVEDIISEEIYEILEGPDYKGNYLIYHKDKPRKIRAHPSRLLFINPEGIPAERREYNLAAKCPKCNNDIIIGIGQIHATCCENTFQLDWGPIEPGPRPVSPESKKPKKIDPQKVSRTKAKFEKNQIDINHIASICELWVKEGIAFNAPHVTVVSHAAIIDDGDNSRKFMFNSYNGSWGGKDRTADLESFISGKRIDNRQTFHFIRITMEQERQKLTKAGYVKYQQTS